MYYNIYISYTLINNLIIDTENAVRHLDTKIQNTFRYLATKI
jgi:hypothetical protein